MRRRRRVAIEFGTCRSGRIGGAAGTVRALRVGNAVIGASGEQKMSRMPRMLICLLAVLLMPSLNACNTARGMGEDIQALGRAMSGTAQDVEEDISAETESRRKVLVGR